MPRLLDVFCGAGGCSAGYARAGFDVCGVDLAPQPRYPFPFLQGDALEFLRSVEPGDYDAIHASPPCQAFSTIAKQRRQMTPGVYDHPDLVEPTRLELQRIGAPYVIENVPGAPLHDPVMICGSSLGLDVRRHRIFETNWPLFVPPCVHGWQTPRFRSLDKRRGAKSVVPVYGGGQITASVVGVHGHINYAGERALREAAMQIDWMTPYELTQAIPPAYTELIGWQLAAHLEARARTC